MTKLNPAFLYLTCAALIWGATIPIMKLTLTQVPLFSLSFIRMGVASILFLPFVIKELKIERVDFKKFFLLAFLGTNLNLGLFFFGLKLTQAINASILVASVPLFTLVAAHFLLKEKIAIKLVLAALIALIGIIMIIKIPALGSETKSIIGNLLLLASSLAWVGYEIIAKKLLKKYSASSITFYTIAIGAAIFFPLFLFEFFKNPLWFTSVTSIGFMGIVFGIIFSSLIAYWTWGKGLSLLPAGQASFFIYLDPVSGITFSIILLGEKISPAFIAGSALILAGVFLAQYKSRPHPLHKF